jgi:hypothetical protein
MNYESKQLNSAFKGKSKRKMRQRNTSIKMVRILEPSYNLTTEESNESDCVPLKLSKNKVFADCPNDLLAGISDMFINADLSCNFAKKHKKIGWDTISTSILNKLHPGNAIFQQQLGKMQLKKSK